MYIQLAKESIEYKIVGSNFVEPQKNSKIIENEKNT